MATQIPDHIQAFITAALDQSEARISKQLSDNNAELATNLDARMDARLKASEARYDKKLQASEARYDKKLQASEARYDKKLQASESRLNVQLNAHEKRFDAKHNQSIVDFNKTVDTRIQILFDEQAGVLKAINERLDDIDSKLENTATKDDMYRLEGRINVTIKAVTATNKDVRNHEKRITALEEKA